VSPDLPANEPMRGAPAVCAASRLKEQTAGLHRQVERSGFQQRLLAGRLPRGCYVGWLEQMLHVYEVLERRLPARESSAPNPGPLSALTWHRSAALVRDLAALGSSGAGPPLRSTAALLAQLEAWAPSQLLGALYVVEGSTNGGRHIAPAVRRAFALEGSDGTGFLDPYGQMQRDAWLGFVTDLNALVRPHDIESTIAAACVTFEAMGSIGAQLLETVSSESASPA